MSEDVHDIQVEQAAIGSILLNNQIVNSVVDFLRPEDFFEPIHGTIFNLCRDMVRAGKPASPVTLRAFLPPGDISGMTVQKYVARLASEGLPISIAVDYARIVRDLSDQRRIAMIGASLRGDAPIDPVALASRGIEELDAIVADRATTGAPALSMRQAVARAIDAAAGAYQRDGRLSGLTWGLLELDDKTLGLQRCEMVILAGRPGMGKTALGLCVARTAAEQNHRGLVISLEMGDVPLTQRMLSDMLFDERPLPYWLLRSGRIEERDFERVTEAGKRLAEYPLRIEQQPALTVAQIGARARQMKLRQGLDFLVVDHLHLVRASERYAGNRVQEIGEVTGGLKALAKELDIAVIALCQLNRGLEGRDDKRPTLSDLRGSGDIEQDADTVVMLYRQAYYLERRKPNESDADEFAQWMAQMEACGNKLEAIVEKQRNGPIGSVKLFCNIGCNAVRNLQQPDRVML